MPNPNEQEKVSPVYVTGELAAEIRSEIAAFKEAHGAAPTVHGFVAMMLEAYREKLAAKTTATAAA